MSGKKKQTYSLSLNSLNALDLSRDIVRGRLESLVGLLDLIDNGLVLEDFAVMSKVDGGLLLLEIRKDTTSLLVALAEGAQSGNGLGLEAEGGRQLGPVDVGGGGLDRHDVLGGGVEGRGG
jgi:hypothetical protein